jgi:sortase (surface protein transpeptidase)
VSTPARCASRACWRVKMTKKYREEEENWAAEEGGNTATIFLITCSTIIAKEKRRKYEGERRKSKHICATRMKEE